MLPRQATADEAARVVALRRRAQECTELAGAPDSRPCAFICQRNISPRSIVAPARAARAELVTELPERTTHPIMARRRAPPRAVRRCVARLRGG